MALLQDDSDSDPESQSSSVEPASDDMSPPDYDENIKRRTQLLEKGPPDPSTDAEMDNETRGLLQDEGAASRSGEKNEPGQPARTTVADQTQVH